jgi:hypothetical protein
MIMHARCDRPVSRLLGLLLGLFSLQIHAASEPLDLSEFEIRELRLELAEHLFKIVALEVQVKELQEDKEAMEKIIGQHRSELAALRNDVNALKAKPGETPTLTLKAPFVVIGNGGRELLRVNDDASGARLAAPFRVTSNNQPRLEVSSTGLNARGIFRVDKEAGGEVARIAPTADGVTFTVGERSGGGINAGVGSSGNGYLVLKAAGGKPAIDMGRPDGTPMGVYVLAPDGVNVRASLGLDENQKGRLRVGDPKGPRGVLGATKSGAMSFGLFDTESSDFRVGMLAAPDETFVRVKGQKNSVHLNTSAEGAAVHIFNSSGNSAASLESTTNGYGKFSLGDADGNTMVQAGTTVDQLGVVRVGPMMGGPLAVPGLPFAILGKKPK